MTDDEIEEAAQQFINSSQWLGPAATADQRSDGADECPYSKRLKQLFEDYESHLTQQTEVLPVSPDSVSFLIRNGSSPEEGVNQSAFPSAKKNSFRDSLDETFSSLWNSLIERYRRTVGEVYLRFRRFVAAKEDQQKQNGSMSRYIAESLAMVGALKVDVVAYEHAIISSSFDAFERATVPTNSIHRIVDQVAELEAHLGQLKSGANQPMSKLARNLIHGAQRRELHRRAMAGLTILTVVTSLWVVGMFHFIVEAKLRSLQNATQKLTGAVQNLSDRIDVPLQIAERAKQPEPNSIGQRVVYANTKVKVDRTKYSRPHSLSMMRHNKKVSTMRIRPL